MSVFELHDFWVSAQNATEKKLEYGVARILAMVVVWARVRVKHKVRIGVLTLLHFFV